MSSPPTPVQTSPPNAALRQNTLIKNLSSQGPSIQEVAQRFLFRELKALYPELDIDPDTTLIVTPIWEFIEDELLCREMTYESLTDALLRQSRDKTTANYVEGEHFLALAPLSPAPVHLEVSIEKIACMLNELVPVFFIEFKEQQLAFWNTSENHLPNWQAFSDGLRQALNVEAVGEWDADHCIIAQGVSSFPDRHIRKAQRPELADIQACMIDVDSANGTSLKHLLLVGAAVVTGRYRKRDVLLMYSVDYGYESFPTTQALNDAIQARLNPQLTSSPLSWRLIEPEGDFFDHMAWALINMQLQTIEALDLSDELQTAFSGDTTQISAPEAAEQARIDRLQEAIPTWLRDASAQDLKDYSQGLIDLSLLHSQAPDDLFEIPSINAFAQQQMRQAILADKTVEGADKLPLDALQITRTESFTVGVFILPNPLDRRTQTLGEYALTNSPPYLARITFKQGQTVPTWLTPGYLSRLAKQVNIGKAYPQLLQSKLIDDPLEAPRQKHKYQRQLRVQLPLLALECKIRQLGDVDARGYAYAKELVHPTPGNRQPIVVRPLSLYPKNRLNSPNDNVLNMFIIGPRNSLDGPCLLYRPLMVRPLLQFPSFQNLLYALHQPGELRDSVLAWLPSRALSFNYSQYVFPVGLPSPWLTVQNLSEPLSLVEWSGPVHFSTTELTGDVFAGFFEAYTKAMVELADRQSLSNAERRWTLLADSGWAVFNAASGFLNGYAGAAVWAWQIITDIQQGLDARQQGNSLIEWTRMGDVLMALAILLIHQGNRRRQRAFEIEKPFKAKSAAAAPVIKPALTIRPTVSATGLLPHSEYAAIAVDGSVPRRTPEQLGTLLEGLKVGAPDLNDPQLIIVTSPETPPLYQLRDKTFAQVDQRWFEVIEDTDENILVLHTRQPSRTGPRLVHDYDERWRVDISLRLLGGGDSLKSKLKASRLAKMQRQLELEQQLKALKERETTFRQQLRVLDVPSGPAADPLTLQRYLDKNQELIELYHDALTQLQAWREAGGATGYIEELFRLSTEYHKHLCLWIAAEQLRYLKRMEQVRRNFDAELGPRQALLDSLTQLAQSGNAMTAKMQRLNTSLEGLPTVGATGVIIAERLKALSPQFTQWDIKTNEIATIYELCMREQAAANMDEARQVVGYVVARAALASKALARMMRSSAAHTFADVNVEHLLDIIDDYASVNQRIDELPADFPDLVEPAHLQRLKALVGEFQQLAQGKLDSLLPQPDKQTGPAKRLSMAGPSQRPPKANISKTRPRDLPAKAGDAPKQEPLETLVGKAPAPAINTKDYRQAVSTALALDVDAYAFIQRTRKDAVRPKRVPADMQDIFDQQAARFEQAADTLDQMMADAQSAGEQLLPVKSLPDDLRTAAARMRQEGIATRATMLKARKPRQTDFQWLLDNAQVRLVRNNAGRIKTVQYKDYFQEYQILDKANQDAPLWLAHFHYPTLDAPASQFMAAHLKIADQHLQRLSPEARLALSTRTPWDNHLRTLSNPLLQAQFLQLEPN